jgi:hypothetical protein
LDPILGQLRCYSACCNKYKLGLHFKIGREMTVWEPKEKNSGCWRHLDLIRHFVVLKKSYFYSIFYMNWCFQLQSFTWFTRKHYQVSLTCLKFCTQVRHGKKNYGQHYSCSMSVGAFLLTLKVPKLAEIGYFFKISNTIFC